MPKQASHFPIAIPSLLPCFLPPPSLAHVCERIIDEQDMPDPEGPEGQEGHEIEIRDVNMHSSERVDASNFELLRVLGQGSFGKVSLCVCV